MSRRIASCGDFSGEVEALPESSGCGGIQAVLRESAQRKMQPVSACDFIAG